MRKPPVLYYRPAANAFFSSDLHGPPGEGDREISASEHSYLLGQQAQGRVICAGEDGRPQAVQPAPPPPADARELRRRAYARESDPLYLEAVYDGTPESMAAWRAKVAEIKGRFPMAGPPPTDPR